MENKFVEVPEGLAVMLASDLAQRIAQTFEPIIETEPLLQG